MIGLHILARRIVLARLKADSGVTSLVPAASIYSQHVPHEPAWPFIKLGPTQTLPRTAACLWGGDVSMLVSAFAKARRVDGAIVETAEDHAGRIGAAIEAALAKYGTAAMFDGKPAQCRITLSDMRLMLDGAEIDAFHYSATARVRIDAA